MNKITYVLKVQLAGGDAQMIFADDTLKFRPLVEAYLQGRLKPEEVIGESDCELPWAVKVSAVVGMQMGAVNDSQLAAQQGGTPLVNPPAGRLLPQRGSGMGY